MLQVFSIFFEKCSFFETLVLKMFKFLEPGFTLFKKSQIPARNPGKIRMGACTGLRFISPGFRVYTGANSQNPGLGPVLGDGPFIDRDLI
jgi:hypothetical protein|uniref:Uncharacterized protein n=1 Tax=Desulfobacca acetoxidans TaxID=60893 RepID=A0A7C5AL23_9BACT